jgi:hypothetical protein
MVVTINTDASFSRKYNVGSYAFFILCNEFKIAKSGTSRKIQSGNSANGAPPRDASFGSERNLCFV